MERLQAGDPARIGSYTLTARLGAGGMGRVFLGESAGGRLVAVKVIHPGLATDPEFRIRFGREVALARRVGGFFTVPVVDADTDAPEPWLATGYVDGPALDDAVRERGPLPASSLLAVAAGLAEGLVAVHAAGVVHRDLKPSNVLLAADGVRVIDFGIARAADHTTLTGTGHLIGTVGFMSPEQAQSRPVGPASDIFSLGGVLMFAATGEDPFGRAPAPQLLFRVVYEAPRLDGLPGQLRDLVARCMDKDPGRRPTAGEFLAALPPVRHARQAGGAGIDWWPPSPVTPPPMPPGASAGRAIPGPPAAGEAPGPPAPIAPPPAVPASARENSALAAPPFTVPPRAVPSPAVSAPAASSPGAPSPGVPTASVPPPLAPSPVPSTAAGPSPAQAPQTASMAVPSAGARAVPSQPLRPSAAQAGLARSPSPLVQDAEGGSPGGIPPAGRARKEPGSQDPGAPGRRGRSRRRFLVITSAVVLVLLAGGGLGAFQWLQGKYYVGADGDHVAVFRGVNRNVLGISLSSTYQATAIQVTQLHAADQAAIRQTVSLSSVAEADRVIERLQLQVNECHQDWSNLAAWQRQNATHAHWAGLPASQRGNTPEPPAAGTRPPAPAAVLCAPASAFGIAASALPAGTANLR